jgi:hypothetical protein
VEINDQKNGQTPRHIEPGKSFHLRGLISARRCQSSLPQAKGRGAKPHATRPRKLAWSDQLTLVLSFPIRQLSSEFIKKPGHPRGSIEVRDCLEATLPGFEKTGCWDLSPMSVAAATPLVAGGIIDT